MTRQKKSNKKENNQISIQTRITDHITTEQNHDKLLIEYGDKLREKEDGIIRIGLQNINGINGQLNASHEVFELMV